jgi:hypothetical protein
VLLPAEVGDVDLAPLARHPRLEWLILERIGLDRPRSLTGLGGLPLERLDLRMGQVDLGGLAAASGLRTLVVVPQGGAVDLGPCRGLPLVRLAVDAPWLRDAEPLLASLPQLQEVAHPSESPLRRDISDRLAARGIEIVDVQPYLPTARQRVG